MYYPAEHKYNNVYIAYENASREFYPRLELAISLKKKNPNASIFIGSKTKLINLSKSHGPGILILKGLDTTERMKKYKVLGHYIVVLSEELSPISSTDATFNYLKREASYSDTSLIDLYLVENNQIEELSNTILKCKVVATGWPRFEISQHIYNNRWIDLSNSNSILFVSNYGINTQIRKKKYVVEAKKELVTNKDMLAITQFVDSKYNGYQRSIEFLNKLNKTLQNYKITVRPHPAESLRQWRRDLNKNITIVDNIADINSYLLSASVLIHPGSTTSYQAKLKNIPTIDIGESSAYSLTYDSIYTDEDIKRFMQMHKEPLSDTYKSSIDNIIKALPPIEAKPNDSNIRSVNMIKKKLYHYINKTLDYVNINRGYNGTVSEFSRFQIDSKQLNYFLSTSICSLHEVDNNLYIINLN